MKQVKTVFTNQGNIGHDEYIDVLIKNIQACSVPKYGGASKLIDPPMVAIKIENSLFIKGVVKGSVGIDWKQPVLRDGKYAAADINFTVEEVTPYSAQDIQRIGSFRNPGDTPIPISSQLSDNYINLIFTNIRTV